MQIASPLCALTIVLFGCATSCPPAPAPVIQTRIVDTACNWVKPISASAADTIETRREVLAHDLAVQKNCGSATHNAGGTP